MKVPMSHRLFLAEIKKIYRLDGVDYRVDPFVLEIFQ